MCSTSKQYGFAMSAFIVQLKKSYFSNAIYRTIVASPIQKPGIKYQLMMAGLILSLTSSSMLFPRKKLKTQKTITSLFSNTLVLFTFIQNPPNILTTQMNRKKHLNA